MINRGKNKTVAFIILFSVYSIVNKILALVILNYFSFHFIKKKKKKNVPTFRKLCCICKCFIFVNLFSFICGS